ncbi:MAG: NfeD family protein [Lachnospiraceae bacterium]|nr:NfeD family protein [Lachnospiraceae bacterium]
MATIIWLVIFVVFLGIEIATLGLTTIWFAGGALLAMLVAAIGLPVYVQIPVFLIVSVVLLLFTRPLAMKYFNKERIRTNAESLVGETAVVTETINNIKGMGKAVINGQEWTARSSTDAVEIEKETKAVIVAIEGVKLIVQPVGQ